jgi:hypothetical protein
MCSKREDYRERLGSLHEWEDFLLAESGLPGPRGNLELAAVVAEQGSREQFERWLTLDADKAPVGSQEEFLAFCGTVGLGRLLAEGDRPALERLRRQSNDPRWRIREAVAMGLQRFGEADMDALLQAMGEWVKGSLLEQRAAIAGLCEPRLLGDRRQVHQVLGLLDQVTVGITHCENRKTEEFKALRKGLAYCWSVAVAALPEEGKPRMEKWFASVDKDVVWIMKQNLRKDRLARVDPAWVQRWRERLGA